MVAIWAAKSNWTAPWWLAVVQVPPPSSQSRAQIFFVKLFELGGGCWCVTGVLCECWLGRLGSASGSLTLTHLYLLFVVLMAALLITVYQCVVGRQIHCREKKEQKNVRLLLLTMYQTSTSCYVYNVLSSSCWLKWGKYFHCPVLTRTSQKQLALQPREE